MTTTRMSEFEVALRRDGITLSLHGTSASVVENAGRWVVNLVWPTGSRERTFSNRDEAIAWAVREAEEGVR